MQEVIANLSQFVMWRAPLSLGVAAGSGVGCAMDNVFTILILVAIAAVAVTLGFGIYSLYRGGDYARSNSNQLMRLRVLLAGRGDRASDGRPVVEIHAGSLSPWSS